MAPKKNICVVTGTRAEYGPLKILLNKIDKSPKMKLSLIVTGMHLLKKYGNTIELIKEDGVPIKDIVPMYEENDIKDNSLGKAVGKAIQLITTSLTKLKPDLLIVAGDRFEPLAAVIAASTLSIPIAHIQGGDSSEIGQIDEQIRHAITKFAHIHFPATRKSAERIRLMGEEVERIHNFGAIALDMIHQSNPLSKKELCKKLELNSNEKIILCVLHPYTFESELAGKQMALVLKVLKELNLQIIVMYPNNDPGSELIIKEIESVRNLANFKVFKNLNRFLFLSLLKNIDLLIGNSSSGIIESPIFQLPVLNLGDRNKGRESGKNVIDSPFEYEAIKEGIKRAFSDEHKEICKKVRNPYGDGTASEKIVKYLENLEINDKLLRKRLTYDLDEL